MKADLKLCWTIAFTLSLLLIMANPPLHSMEDVPPSSGRLPAGDNDDYDEPYSEKKPFI